jgi:ubiquinone/menaquinone biosynthesis C-methylase UbiE
MATMPGSSPLPRGATIEGALPDAGSAYDGHAALYDRLVASRIYNHLAWSADPADYEGFARRAVTSASGPLLEVAAGTAIASAPAYRASDRPVVVTDRSRDMLTHAARRLADGGRVRPGVRFVQADAFDLPFAPGTFDTVLCLGFLHLVDDPLDLSRRLRRQLRPGGRLFFSSLVPATRVGSAYLTLLHRAGQVATPRTPNDLAQLFGTTVRRRGCMAYVELG